MSINILEKKGYILLNESTYNYKELLSKINLLKGFTGFDSYIIRGRNDDYGRVVIIVGDSVIRLVQERNKKYHFELDFDVMHKYHTINYKYQNEAIIDIIRPNDIGVFTQKKINDWINYIEKKIRALDILLIKHSQSNVNLQKQIDDFICSIPKKTISTYQNKTRIHGQYFDVTFELDTENSNLHRTIEYKGGLSNVTKFENI